MDTEEDECGDNSCNPATNECTNTERNSVPSCGACVADSECGVSSRCVNVTYMGAANGSYCLLLQSAGCERPFGGVLIEAASVSGAAEASYCGIDQSALTCAAVKALVDGKECLGGQASECAAQSARCETIGGFDNQCTYSCGVSNQCPDGVMCASGYCGGS